MTKHTAFSCSPRAIARYLGVPEYRPVQIIKRAPPVTIVQLPEAPRRIGEARISDKTLSIVYAHVGEATTTNQIADRICKSRVTVTSSMRILCERGLVERCGGSKNSAGYLWRKTGVKL